MSKRPDLDTGPCFEIAARLAGAIALLSAHTSIDTDDELHHVRRLLRDALAITDRYTKSVDEYTTAVRNAERSREVDHV